MLVLTRRCRQRIILGNGVIIELVKLERGKAKLAITAPKDVGVWREELLGPQAVARAERLARGEVAT